MTENIKARSNIRELTSKAGKKIMDSASDISIFNNSILRQQKNLSEIRQRVRIKEKTFEQKKK